MPQAKTLHLVAAEGGSGCRSSRPGSASPCRPSAAWSTAWSRPAASPATTTRPIAARSSSRSRPRARPSSSASATSTAASCASLLELLADDDLDAVEQAVVALTRAAERQAASRPPRRQRAEPATVATDPPPAPAPTDRRPRKGPLVNRITEFAVRRRSVTLLLAAAVFISGAYAWGNLQQELLPDIEFPIITVIAPYPGSGRRRRHRPGDQADRAGDLAASSAWPTSSRRRPTRSRWSSPSSRTGRTSRRRAPRSSRTWRPSACRRASRPQVNALNINQQPVIIASISGTGDAGLEEAARIARTDIVPALQGLDGVGAVDVTGGLEQRLLITLDPAKLAEPASRSSRSTASSPPTT